MELMLINETSSFFAILNALPMSRECIAPDKPYPVLFTKAIASSSVLIRVIASAGPKVSVREMSECNK